MLWIALFCPTLPLDRIQRRLPDSLAPPVAVTSVVQSMRRSVAMVNAVASAGGVRPGLSVASALAMLPQLMLFERDPADESVALREVALAALRFTPSVVLKPEGLLLEVLPSLRLFGGRRALLERLAQLMRQSGLNAGIDWAPTAAAAWMLARHAPVGQLPEAAPESFRDRSDCLPLRLLDNAAAIEEQLVGFGCRTLADLRRLPRAALARRCGRALLDEIDRVRGDQADPQSWFVAPEHFEGRLELLARIETAPALLVAVQHLMIQLSGWLQARHVALQSLTLVLHHEGRARRSLAPTRLTIKLAEALADVDHLTGLLRERLARQPLVAPVEEIGLLIDDLVTRGAVNQELFATRQSEAAAINRLVEKLVARLGNDAVQRLRSCADHRPERALSWVSADALAPRQQVSATRASAALRPAWLMPTPVALKIEAHKPVHGGALSLLAGPERIEAGWWDDALVTRDYFIAKNAMGQLLWVFRERQVLDNDTVWYLHGLFG